MIDLRPHQQRLLDELKVAVAPPPLGRGKSRVMAELPTGGGKTRVAGAIILGALRKGHRVVFTVPAIDLIDQTVQAFYDLGIRDVGVIQANHPMTDRRKPVQVASVQTLARRDLPPTDIVIVDEAHRAYRVIHDWMKVAPKTLFVGLSATPWTRGLGKHYDDLIIAATTAELIEEGFLSRFRVFAPSQPDLTGVRTVAGDYHEGDLSEAMDKPVLTADIIETWLRMGGGRPPLCFGVDKAHAMSLKRQFDLVGVPAAYIDDHTDRAERDRIRRAFARGDVKVVCNIGVLTTGIDWDVRCLILARPTKSEILYTQIVGRALRIADGKADALILDHSDTTLRLGFVTDIHHATLDGHAARKASERKQYEGAPSKCPACSFLRPTKVQKCPACGFVPERQANVEQREGRLVAVKPKPKDDKFTKLAWYSGLLFIAKERRYQRGWAARKFRERFGVWPRQLAEWPQPPTPEVRRFIVHSQIAYAKRKPSAAA